MLSSEALRLLFPLALGKGKADFLTAELVFLVYIFNKCLKVGEWFIGHGAILFALSHRYLL
jgi:hypothetical protein